MARWTKVSGSSTKTSTRTVRVPATSRVSQPLFSGWPRKNAAPPTLRPITLPRFHNSTARVHAIGKKLVEEAAESWMAAEYESKERAAEELSQLLYHAQVMMHALGLDLDDVYRHL